MLKRIFFITGVILLAIGSYYLFSYFSVDAAFRHDDISNDQKFDKNIWQNGTTRQRGQMVNYLLDSIGVVDKSKKEIIAILGEPDRQITPEDGEYKFIIVYAMEKGHAFSYDMIISFDSTSHAKNVMIDD